MSTPSGELHIRRFSSPSKDNHFGSTNGPNLVPPILAPILPAYIRDARYHGDARVKLTSTAISLGAHFSSAPSYRSQGWTVSIHPEGKRYAYNTAEDGVSVVTEAHVTDSNVAEQLEACLAMLRVLAAEENVHLPATTDLFLEIDQDTETCSYWFADHAQRTVFWLHPMDSDTAGLPDSYSMRHRQYSLEENYWAHVEMFPATASQYSATALNELTVILLNARADALTSEIPTFPYTADECERFINLLNCSKEHASNSYITTFVARLWVVVANHRYFTHFGEDHCRMSSMHSILESPPRKRNIILTAISKLLFDLPIEHRQHLEQLWVDQLVYSAAWRKHTSDRAGDLLQKMTWIFALAIANILILPISYCPELNKSSIVLCILGLCITLVLYQEQRKLVNTGGTVGVSPQTFLLNFLINFYGCKAAYLDTRDTAYGFEPTAIIHSIPLASFVYAFFLFAIQGFWMALGDLPRGILLPTMIAVAVVLGLVFIGVWIALNPREKPFGDSETPLPAPVALDISIDSKELQTVDGMV
ncbi:hypothetical protein V8E52_006258 [Russula decolorans]